jgi:putative iron-only hydrogenase system regulator
MEIRIGTAIIIIDDPEKADILNRIISEHSALVLSRQGLPMRERGFSIISMVLEGTTDDLGALTGKIGKIDGVRIKSVLAS